MQRVEAVQAVDAFCSWIFQGKTDQNAGPHPYPLALPALHGAGMRAGSPLARGGGEFYRRKNMLAGKAPAACSFSGGYA